MSSGWLKGVVKGVPSGDCLLIAGSGNGPLPPEKAVTLASLVAPRLVRRRARAREPRRPPVG